MLRPFSLLAMHSVHSWEVWAINDSWAAPHHVCWVLECPNPAPTPSQQQSHTGGGGEQGLSVCMGLGGEEEAPGTHSAAGVGKESLECSHSSRGSGGGCAIFL